mmetsp:Transcript_84126/g.132834  ORF Transcript_84126/g.132834 Transcript_84126/m.132834 type:complete len:368 (+) Transcript_84126:43-1146(+)|eukprot:CAMPEP_0169087526 /NCGR_PEP_ID=MMETSP1015-20121227/14277_1 /TAXON_ID=342587 /ORGANISM="Karlodinium micrum, Strain CCMP2283" /LENGTH=367 /DNA_ID=CAMNT_0009147759 /DNA_START=43 /DNA_END=1146 /DNA_ORIENTATION=+
MLYAEEEHRGHEGFGSPDYERRGRDEYPFRSERSFGRGDSPYGSRSRPGSPSRSFHHSHNEYNHYDHYGRSYDNGCCPGEHGVHGHHNRQNLRELFMYVYIEEIEEHPLKSMQKWIGNMVTNRAESYKDMQLMRENMSGILSCAGQTMAAHGWQAFAQPMHMPQVPGQLEQRDYLQIGRAGPPTLVVVRLHLSRRIRNQDDCLDCCAGIFDQCKAPQPPQTHHEKESIARYMTGQLRNLRNEIRANVQVMDFRQLYSTLVQQHGFNEHATREAMLRARNEGEARRQVHGDDPTFHNNYGNGHNTYGNAGYGGGGYGGSGYGGGAYGGGGYGGGGYVGVGGYGGAYHDPYPAGYSGVGGYGGGPGAVI